MSHETVDLLQDLIAIDSVNPSLVPGGAGEAEVAGKVAQWMGSAGLDVVTSEVAPGRPNVVGVLDGRSDGPALLFCGHTDTVGVAGMKGPFDPVEQEGRIYGRGAEDMKGGLAAMMGAAGRLARDGVIGRGRLIVACVVDEEYGSLGAEALVRDWTADAAVVTEPTSLVIGVGHRGFSWVEVKTEGRAAHGSRPKDGRDAIFRMGRVLARLESLDRELQSRPAHPILGTGSLHASLIQGGREMSTYPDEAVLLLERRTVSGEGPETALGEVEEILRQLGKEDPEFRATARRTFDRPPYVTPEDASLPESLASVLARIGREARRDGMSFWTDAAVLGGAGIASVVFGPSGAGLHELVEYVRVDDVLACEEALYQLGRELLA